MPRKPDRRPPHNRPTGDRLAWAICGFLLLAVGIIYAQTLRHQLLDYDDNEYVYANPHVRAGLSDQGVQWALTSGPYGEWYPLAMLSHMLDCQIYGTRPWGHHLTNVLLHAATSIALFLVWRSYTNELWPSAFVAAVFAVHPQHVESVAWVSERRDVLSGLLFVLTLGAWLGYQRHGRRLPRYLLAAALFALGLMAKPMIVTLPGVLLILDFWPLARLGGAVDVPPWTKTVERPSVARLLWEKLPLAGLAAAACWITLVTHVQLHAPLPWGERIANAAVSCVTYLVQFVYPAQLAVFYPMPPGGEAGWKVAAALAMLLAVSAAVIVWRRRCPYLPVGWFWYLGMLVPVLGLVTVSEHVMADRYMYLPGIGLYIAIAWGATRLASGWAEGRWMLATCGGLLIVGFAACAAWQSSVWQTDETLWRHALAVTHDRPGRAELGVADALAHQKRFDEAIPHYRRAQEYPSDSAPYNNLGSVYAQQGKLMEAVAEFRRAVEIEPSSFRAHANLAAALAQQHRFGEAMDEFQRALEIDEGNVPAHLGVAHLLRQAGKIEQARREFQRAVEIDPGSFAARHDLALTLCQLGRLDEAIPQFAGALAADPRSTLAHANMAQALATLGRYDEAIAHCRRALEIDPKNAAVRSQLDRLLHGPGGEAGSKAE